MSYVPHTVLAGGLTGLPQNAPRQRVPFRRPYKKYERSPTAKRVMALACSAPGTLASEFDEVLGLCNSYVYLATLRLDKYLETTTERNAKNMPVTRVWPTKLFLAKFPATL